MDTKAHPISLVRVVFTRSTVIAIPEHATHESFGNTAPAPTNTLNMAHADHENGQYEVSMRTLLNQEGFANCPYLIDMECFGTFRADITSISKDEAIRGVMITAHSVLYGAIREAISWITGRQPYGPLVLGLSVLKPQQKEDSNQSKD